MSFLQFKYLLIPIIKIFVNDQIKLGTSNFNKQNLHQKDVLSSKNYLPLLKLMFTFLQFLKTKCLLSKWDSCWLEVCRTSISCMYLSILPTWLEKSVESTSFVAGRKIRSSIKLLLKLLVLADGSGGGWRTELQNEESFLFVLSKVSLSFTGLFIVAETDGREFSSLIKFVNKSSSGKSMFSVTLSTVRIQSDVEAPLLGVDIDEWGKGL